MVGLSGHINVIAEIKDKHNLVDSKCNILYQYPHNIDILAFNDDKLKCKLIANPKADLSQLYEHNHNTLKSLLDKHAPVRSKSVKVKPPGPWMSHDSINAKGRRRYL